MTGNTPRCALAKIQKFCYNINMKNIQRQPVIENIKDRTRTRAVELLAKTKSIRRNLARSGDWDSVKVLRDIRYAQS